MVRILRLGNSADEHPSVPLEVRARSLIAQRIQEEFDEPTEMEVRRLWPTEALPALIDRWMSDFEPEAVIFLVSTYWFGFESLPLRVERRFGPLGRPLRCAGDAATKGKVGRLGAFHWARRALLNTVGGETHFTPEEVVSRCEGCIRAILAHEPITLVVRGPISTYERAIGQRASARGERRRRQVHRELKALCARLHVEYIGEDVLDRATERSARSAGDGVHYLPQEHARRGGIQADALVGALRRARGEVGSGTEGSREA